jgi:hypothetical protein
LHPSPAAAGKFVTEVTGYGLNNFDSIPDGGINFLFAHLAFYQLGAFFWQLHD